MRIPDNMTFWEFIWATIGSVAAVVLITFLLTCMWECAIQNGNVDYCYVTKYGPGMTLTMHRSWSDDKTYSLESLDEVMKVASVFCPKADDFVLGSGK